MAVAHESNRVLPLSHTLRSLWHQSRPLPPTLAQCTPNPEQPSASGQRHVSPDKKFVVEAASYSKVGRRLLLLPLLIMQLHHCATSFQG